MSDDPEINSKLSEEEKAHLARIIGPAMARLWATPPGRREVIFAVHGNHPKFGPVRFQVDVEFDDMDGPPESA